MSVMYNRRRKDRQQMNRQHLRELTLEHAKTRGVLVQFFHRGFIGRLKWLLFGR